MAAAGSLSESLTAEKEELTEALKEAEERLAVERYAAGGEEELAALVAERDRLAEEKDYALAALDDARTELTASRDHNEQVCTIRE